MVLALILLITGVLTFSMGAMYFALQINDKPGLSFYTSPGTAQIILAVIVGSFALHWSVGVAVVVLLIYLFICALKWGHLT